MRSTVLSLFLAIILFPQFATAQGDALNRCMRSMPWREAKESDDSTAQLAWALQVMPKVAEMRAILDPASAGQSMRLIKIMAQAQGRSLSLEREQIFTQAQQLVGAICEDYAEQCSLSQESDDCKRMNEALNGKTSTFVRATEAPIQYLVDNRETAEFQLLSSFIPRDQ